MLYAGPKLASYVSQKIVADSDKPLGLLEYLACHLSAYTAGHLEGPLTPWWPIGLIGRSAGLGTLASFSRSARSKPLSRRKAAPSRFIAPFQVIRFLLIGLAVVLLLGWLVNLTFPFFPDRGERLLLLGLPLFTLLIATVSPPSGTLAQRRGSPPPHRSRFPSLHPPRSVPSPGRHLAGRLLHRTTL